MIALEDDALEPDGQRLANETGEIWAKIGNERKPTHICPLKEVRFQRGKKGKGYVPCVYHFWYPIRS